MEVVSLTRILLTRSREGNSAWAAELKDLGYGVETLDSLVHEPIVDPATRARFLNEWARADWVVFSSERGVEAAAGLLPRPRPDGPMLATVGPTTAEACRRLLGRCDVQSPEPTGKGLARHLLAQLTNGQRVVAAAADRGRRDLEQVLEPAGFEVHRVAVYRTRVAATADRKVDLNRMKIDVVFFGSPSAIEGVGALANWEKDGTLPAIAIGPTTARALASSGFRVGIAERPDLAGMLGAMEKMLCGTDSTEHRSAARPRDGEDG